uniref:THAP-type domain-containing protein n=1 Tax=Pundamilia nyererei TaxID=303518 RepID=A0A3B4GZL0_9CICH
MVRSCCAVGCNVRSHSRKGNKVKKGLSFHSFPTWTQHKAAHVSDFSSISKYLLVCSRHFHSGHFLKKGNVLLIILCHVFDYFRCNSYFRVVIVNHFV